MVEIDISKNHKAEALKLAERATILLEEIAADMLSLEYLWDEIQCRYYEDKRYEEMDNAMNCGYPFRDSYEDVVSKVLQWNEHVSGRLDKIFGGEE